MKNFYLTYKSPVSVILFLIILGGVYVLTNMQTGLFPNITFPKVKVIAENGEQPIHKMMITVTMPLENAIKKVPDLRIIRSTTSRGSCEISAFFDWGADIDLGKQRLEARINAIKQDLPPGISLTVEKMNPSILQVMGYSLESDSLSLIELRQLAVYTVKPYLSRVSGVSEIAVIGGKEKEYHIILDPVRMSNLGITIKQAAEALTKSNFILSGGYVTDYNRLYLSLTDASIKNIRDIENTVILNDPRRVVRVKDIAHVEVEAKKTYVKINANGKNVPLVGVLKQPGANLIDVSREIRRSVAQLNKMLPEGVRLVPYYDQANFVNGTISSLRDVLWVGLLLAIIVTILFLRSFKASAVVLITIPVTLSLSGIVIFAIGYNFNIMTIGAIAAAIGLIIDDAIVVVEQIHRTHEEFPEESHLKLVSEALKYLLPAMVGSSLSTIVIFLPFMLMSGVAGEYFKVMTNTMIITLVCSFFVTWIGLPVLYILLSKKNPKKKITSKEVKKRSWVRFIITRPYIAITLIILLIVSAWFIIPGLPSGFLPEMDEGSLVLDFNSPPGTSLDETDKMLRKVDNILKNTPEVESFSRRLGTQMGFFITEPNRGDYLIKLKKGRTKTTMEVADVIRRHIEATLPALTVDFGQVIGDMLGDLMATAQPIEIKIYGDDQETLKKYAKKVARVVRKVRGTADVFDGITIAGPEIIVKPDNILLARYNISPDDFQFDLKNIIEGNIIGTVIERNRLSNIRLLSDDIKEISLNDIKKSPLILPDGKLKPLSDFADVKISKGVAEIEREQLKSMIALTARLNNRDLGSTLQEIRKKIAEQISLPSGYHIEYGGAYAEQQKAFSELLMILVLSSFLVFVVILFLFKNLRIAFVIIFLSVIGLAGSLIALWLTKTPLNVGSYTGMIMIVGIIGENSIFTYLQYRNEKKASSRDDAIVYSISTRLRPKLMTALGAITALLPLAMGIGTGAQMHQPLAIAIIGGMIIALPLLLVALPTFIRLVEK